MKRRGVGQESDGKKSASADPLLTTVFVFTHLHLTQLLVKMLNPIQMLEYQIPPSVCPSISLSVLALMTLGVSPQAELSENLKKLSQELSFLNVKTSNTPWTFIFNQAPDISILSVNS